MQTGIEIEGEKQIDRSLNHKICELGIARGEGNWIPIPIIQICTKNERNRLYYS
jgi:hypothetical protein